MAYASSAGTLSAGGRFEDAIDVFEHAVWFLPKKLILRILLVLVITVLLLTLTPLLLRWWRGTTPKSALVENGSDAHTAMTVTDLNIRSGPSLNAQKIGLAERSSRVRVISCNQAGTWCEIEVLQHGRDKVDQSSSDHGWVSKKYLELSALRGDW